MCYDESQAIEITIQFVHSHAPLVAEWVEFHEHVERGLRNSKLITARFTFEQYNID